MIAVPQPTAPHHPHPLVAIHTLEPTTVLITGAAGFIGSALLQDILQHTKHHILAIDALTYASHPHNIPNHPRITFARADINDTPYMKILLKRFNPTITYHLAAETHVDRSIDDPTAFMHTNALGTSNLLQATLEHWRTLPHQERQAFRFIQVSTDEVFGHLGLTGRFTATTPYAPRSPYAASKAASDHIARAYHLTYGLPTIVTNCGNNYGPRQHPEKLIPQLILRATRRLPLPIYGDGTAVRDWIHVQDHTRALMITAEKAAPGSTILIGANNELTTLEVAHAITTELDRTHPHQAPHSRLITHVPDRPAHDRRYAIDPTTSHALDWAPTITFTEGIRDTIRWYLNNPTWVENAANIDKRFSFFGDA